MAKKVDEFPSLFQNRLDMVVKGLGMKVQTKQSLAKAAQRGVGMLAF